MENFLKPIKVKVFPNSNKEEVIEKSKDSFEVRVKVKPKKGLANKAVINALASHFKIPESKIRLIKGFKEKNKIFEISN
ncbi:MAG: DUF167 domain-containing protein [Minisyncoccales bacterium]